MKAAFLAYHSVFDDEIHTILERVDCKYFYEVPKVWAQDEKEKRFGTHIYPGTDSVIVAFMVSEKAQRLLAAIRQFKSEGAQKGHTRLALCRIEEFL
jgi:hypothetical protein